MQQDPQTERPTPIVQDAAQEASEKVQSKGSISGKKQGSTTYKPAENMKMIEIAEELGITSSEGEKDKLWPILVSLVSKATGIPARTATAGAEHLKDMVKVIRSLSSAYSMQLGDKSDAHCPESKGEGFEDAFDTYAEGLWKWVSNLPKKELEKVDYKSSWWDEPTFKAARLYVLNVDLAMSCDNQKEKVNATKSKMEEENAEKRRRAEARKRKLDEEEDKKRDTIVRLFTGLDTMVAQAFVEDQRSEADFA